MKLLFQIDTYSNYGPQVTFIKVETLESRAFITDISQETIEVDYDSKIELIKYVREHFKDAFMTAPETQVIIEAEPEIEVLVRELFWNGQVHLS